MTAKSSATAIILLLALFLPSLLLPIHSADAQFNPFVIDVKRLAESVEAAITRTIVRGILNEITNNITGWITGNGGKDVGFVQNLGKELQKTGDGVGGELLNQITGVNLCGNVSAFLKVTLSTPAVTQQQKIEESFSCSVTAIAGNFENFFNDFTKGGWPAFVQISLEPQNNPQGALLMSLDAMASAQTNQKDALKAQYQAGAGFLGFEVCEKGQTGANGGAKGATPSRENCKVKTPGQLISGMLQKTTVAGIDVSIIGSVIGEEIDSAVNAIMGALLQKVVGFSTGNGPGLFGDNSNDALATSLPPPQDKNKTSAGRVNRLFLETAKTLSTFNTTLTTLYKTLAEQQTLYASGLSGKDQSKIDAATANITKVKNAIAELEKNKPLVVKILQRISGIDPNTSLLPTDVSTPDNVRNFDATIDIITELAQSETELNQAIFNTNLIVDLNPIIAANVSSDPITDATQRLDAIIEVAQSYIDLLKTFESQLPNATSQLADADKKTAQSLLDNTSFESLPSDEGNFSALLVQMNSARQAPAPGQITLLINRVIKGIGPVETRISTAVKFLP